MVHLLRQKATRAQLAEMLETLGGYIKLAVDIEQEIGAGAGPSTLSEQPLYDHLGRGDQARVRKVVEALLGGV